MNAFPPVAETVEVTGCQIGAIELPNGGLALLFEIPGIRRYSFPLDQNARKVLARLCQGSGVILASEMPK